MAWQSANSSPCGRASSSPQPPRLPRSPARRHSMPAGSARTSTRCSITTPRLVADRPVLRGLIDTSVVIDLDHVSAEGLPGEIAVSAVTLAELAAGPHATPDPQERARRQDRLQRAEATFEPLPVDANVARAYGRVCAAVAGGGGQARGARPPRLPLRPPPPAPDPPLFTPH